MRKRLQKRPLWAFFRRDNHAGNRTHTHHNRIPADGGRRGNPAFAWTGGRNPHPGMYRGRSRGFHCRVGVCCAGRIAGNRRRGTPCPAVLFHGRGRARRKRTAPEAAVPAGYCAAYRCICLCRLFRTGASASAGRAFPSAGACAGRLCGIKAAFPSGRAGGNRQLCLL